MAASRLSKDDAANAIPYLWNAAPRTVPSAVQHSQAKGDDQAMQAQYQRGYRDGETAGKAAKTDVVLEELTESIAALAATRSSLFHAAQGDVLKLAMAVARRVLHREVMISPDVLGGVIAVALERIEEHDLHTVRVHPSFVHRISEHLSERAGGRQIQVTGDPSLPLGGCVFETQHGNVDCGLETQLSEIERGLADHLEVMR